MKINFEYVVLLFKTSFYFSRRRTTFHDVVLLFTTSSCFSRRRPTFHDVVLLFTTSSYFSRRRSSFQDVVLLFTTSSYFSRRRLLECDISNHLNQTRDPSTTSTIIMCVTMISLFLHLPPSSNCGRVLTQVLQFLIKS